ncbi:unnamed protein product, partial [Meganyctiphanes norvegica]
DEKPLSWDQLLLEVQSLFSTTYHIRLPTSLELSLDKMSNIASSSNIPSKKLYDISEKNRQQKLVRIVTQNVPVGIFPKHYTAKLYDISICGEMPDYIIYNKHADLRKYIRRGTTLMSIDRNNSKKNMDVVLYANRKFTGNFGDDDDESLPGSYEIWRDYCIDKPDESEQIVAMEKLDGETAHFSGRFIDGNFYIITGSKNIHMLISCEEDIEKYKGGRYESARVIARVLWKYLMQMQKDKRQILFSLLHHTKCTVVCELLSPDHQRIKNFSSLNVNRNSLVTHI